MFILLWFLLSSLISSIRCAFLVSWTAPTRFPTQRLCSIKSSPNEGNHLVSVTASEKTTGTRRAKAGDKVHLLPANLCTGHFVAIMCSGIKEEASVVLALHYDLFSPSRSIYSPAGSIRVPLRCSAHYCSPIWSSQQKNRIARLVLIATIRCSAGR